MAVLLPHQAGYAILDPGGRDVGVEELTLAAHGAGTRVVSRLETEFPAALRVDLDWELDARLVTRRLLIQSRSGWGEEYEIELTVTGNGLLAHRVAPDGPTQVELGWGPEVELDHLSAAFATVMAARSALEVGHRRRLDTVYLAPEDLLPGVVARELLRLPDEAGATVLLNRAVDTGHEVRLELHPSGALRGYEGLLRLERITLSPAPTK
jgi:hypothetical protein